MYTIDFETYYDKQFSLSKLTTEQYIRDDRFEVIGVAVKHDDGPTVFHAADPADWKTSIQQALSQYHFENEVVIAHNAVFDMAILNWHFGIKPKFIVDTLSMARPLTMMTVGGSLRALSELFNIGHKGTAVYDMLGKHRTDMTVEEIKDYGEYCKLDVDLTYQLFHKLKAYSTPSEMFVIDCLMRMFTEPMLVLDKDLLRKHLETVQNRNRNLLKETGLESRDDLMSNPKFAELLKSMGVTPPMKISERTGKETYAFSKKDLEFTALLEHPDDRVQALVAARLGLKSTIEETRTEMFLGIAERGGLPIMLNYYGGHTGRASGAGTGGIYDPTLSELLRLIDRYWVDPQISSGASPEPVLIAFEIDGRGGIAVRSAQRSGDPAIDASVAQLLKKLQTMRIAPPEGRRSKSYTVRLRIREE